MVGELAIATRSAAPPRLPRELPVDDPAPVRIALIAAALLGARRWQIVARIVVPPLLPALITGTTLAFARAVGEYGSVIFIAGNMPRISEIVPLLIIIKLEQFDYAGATIVAVAMLAVSLLLLLAVNLLQAWTRRHYGG